MAKVLASYTVVIPLTGQIRKIGDESRVAAFIRAVLTRFPGSVDMAGKARKLISLGGAHFDVSALGTDWDVVTIEDDISGEENRREPGPTGQMVLSSASNPDIMMVETENDGDRDQEGDSHMVLGFMGPCAAE